VVPESEARAALAALGGAAARIGTVAAERPGMVTVRSLMGGERLARLPSGEQLPRIC
jgi:hydrogenase expression/formation protein HypE